MIKGLSCASLENLFLMEIYIESIMIDYQKISIRKELLESLKEVIIQMQFLGFKHIEIREGEFIESKEKDDCGLRMVKAGKSCLFSVRDLPDQLKCIEMSVNIRRTTGDIGWLDLGCSSIRLEDKFARILKSPKSTHKRAKVKGKFTLYDCNCREVGYIQMTVGLSCFGKMITMSFELAGEDNKAYVVRAGSEVPFGKGKGESDSSIFTPECLKQGAGENDLKKNEDCRCGPCYDNGSEPQGGTMGCEQGSGGGMTGLGQGCYGGMPGSYGGTPGVGQGPYGGTPGVGQGSYGGMTGLGQGCYGGMPGLGQGSYGGMPGSGQGCYGGMPGLGQGSYGGMPGCVPGYPPFMGGGFNM